MKRLSMLALLFGGAALTTASLKPSVAPSGEREKRHTDAVERLTDEFLNRGIPTTIDAVYAKDAIHHSPMGDLDLEGRKMTRGALGMALPDFKVEIVSMTSGDDWVSALYSFNGTFTGSLPTPDGKQIPGNNAGIRLVIGSFYRFNNLGLMAESWETFDNLSLSAQMGLLPAPR
jgi:predicted ester cyclase